MFGHGYETRAENKDQNRHEQVIDPWMGVQAAAAYAGVCCKTVRRAYERRELEHTRVGRMLKFRRSWIDAWIERQHVATAA
jgi:excisionase family DNA binding protein